MKACQRHIVHDPCCEGCLVVELRAALQEVVDSKDVQQRAYKGFYDPRFHPTWTQCWERHEAATERARVALARCKPCLADR